MTSLDKLLEEEVAQKLPRAFLEKMLREKLQEAGAPENDKLVDALIEYIETGAKDTFFWDDEEENNDQQYMLDITEDDVSQLTEGLTDFLKNGLQGVIKDTLEGVAADGLQDLLEKWPEIEKHEKSATSRFRNNLEKRWGDAFSSLRMMVSLCREMGEIATAKFNDSKSRKDQILRFVLLKQHSRACRIAGEIVTLIEHGYAEGALARWRTLHELVIVAIVLSDGGEELAIRYADHEIVETKKQMDEHQKHFERLGCKPVPYRERQQIDKEHERVVKKYGKEFTGDHGWAARHLNNKNPRLNHLQEAAANSHMRPFYKLACQDVHAGAKSMFNSINTLFEDDALMISGPSNAGFQEPAQNTAIALAQISSLLSYDDTSKADYILKVNTLSLLRDEVSRKFNRVAENIEREHLSIYGE